MGGVRLLIEHIRQDDDVDDNVCCQHQADGEEQRQVEAHLGRVTQSRPSRRVVLGTDRDQHYDRHEGNHPASEAGLHEYPLRRTSEDLHEPLELQDRDHQHPAELGDDWVVQQGADADAEDGARGSVLHLRRNVEQDDLERDSEDEVDEHLQRC